MTADVTVSAPLLATCLTAVSDDLVNIAVTFDGLATSCGNSRAVVMEVSVAGAVEPGEYTITIEEVDLGGSLVNTYQWPLTVLSAGTTTTTTSTTSSTTTTTSSTTTTTATDSTTTSSTTTTSTVASSTSSTSRSTGDTPTDGDGEAGATSTSSLPGSPDDSTTTATKGSELATGPGRSGALDATGADVDSFSDIAFSSGLVEVVGRALPPVFAEGIVSPLVIFEVLVRSLGRTVWGLLLPVGVTTLLGFGLMWRLRVDPDSLDDPPVDFPDHDTSADEAGS